jgi:Holliday junction resolvasome RuvABC ATP-dependent DNA helicase subunit
MVSVHNTDYDRADGKAGQQSRTVRRIAGELLAVAKDCRYVKHEEHVVMRVCSSNVNLAHIKLPQAAKHGHTQTAEFWGCCVSSLGS